MAQLEVVLDPQVEVSPAELVSAWNGHAQARAVGQAAAAAAPPGDFAGVMEMVVIPAAIGLGVNGITALVGGLVARIRKERTGQPELEVTEMTRSNGDRIVMVRLRKLPR